MHFTSTLLALISTLGLTSAGINCEGNANCPGVNANLGNLIGFAAGIDDNRFYQNGQHIVCEKSQSTGAPGLCAFLQNTGGVPGSSIKTLLQDLQDHGCKKCGSVPVFFPSDNNDGDHGILTVNEVGNTDGCDGLC